MPPAKSKGSTLMKPTSTSDGRRGGALAQRALTAPREMRAEDLQAKGPAPKRGRENDAPAGVRSPATAHALPPCPLPRTHATPAPLFRTLTLCQPTAKAAKTSKYGRVPVPAPSAAAAAAAPAEASMAEGSMGDTARSGGSMESGASAAAAPAPALAAVPKKPLGKAARVPAVRAAAPPPPASAMAESEGAAGSAMDEALGGGASASASASSAVSAPLSLRTGSGVAGDFLIEDGEHLVFKDPKWMRDALASAKRLLAKSKYGGSPEEFRVRPPPCSPPLRAPPLPLASLPPSPPTPPPPPPPAALCPHAGAEARGAGAVHQVPPRGAAA